MAVKSAQKTASPRPKGPRNAMAPASNTSTPATVGELAEPTTVRLSSRRSPELGQFLGGPPGADTLVPDPGNLFDYNRYMYTRGNPMKYNDPTGHCATLDNGDAD